jgi:outer membrane protein TolC
LSPIAATAAEMQVGGAEPQSAPSKNSDLPDPPVQNIPPQVIESSLDSLPSQKVDEFHSDLPEPPVENIPPQAIDGSPDSPPSQKVDGQVADGIDMPGKRNLAELIGKSEIPVLADVDGQFVKSMVLIRIMENAFANQIVGANLLESELIGNSAIPVLADVDGQFESQLMEEEFASHVDEANLLESIRAGRSFNRESLAALARSEQAKAQTGQAFALLLPSVSVRASRGYEQSQPSVEIDETTGEPISSDTHLRTDYALTVRQPLFDLPSFLDWRRRKVIEQAREENYRVSDGDAYISAVNAYLSLVSSRLQADMTRDFETQLTELLSYIEKRASAGAASISDMARVRARSQATLSSRLEQESAHAAAGTEFVRLTNLIPRKVRLPVLEDVGASLLPESFDMAVTTAMKSNPEIAALTAEVQAAKIDKSAATGRFLPRVDAEYTDTYALHAGGDLSSSGQRDKRSMMVLNWNLFSGGSDYKNHVERTERHKELRYRLDDQRRRVVQTLLANYATLATTRERITSGYQELESISTAAEAMSKRMLSGNQSLLDLLDVYDRFYQVRSRLVSLHILEMSTVSQLVRLTLGTPEVRTEPTGGRLKSTTDPLANDAPEPLENNNFLRVDN